MSCHGAMSVMSLGDEYCYVWRDIKRCCLEGFGGCGKAFRGSQKRLGGPEKVGEAEIGRKSSTERKQMY